MGDFRGRFSMARNGLISAREFSLFGTQPDAKILDVQKKEDCRFEPRWPFSRKL